MANISVTNTFVNGQSADAGEVNTNFTDIINGTSDGTKDLSVSAGTFAGSLTCNGAVTLGNGTGDDITFAGSLASSMPIKTDGSYDIGSTTLGLQIAYFGDGGGNTVGVQAPAIAANFLLTLPGHTAVMPASDGAADDYVVTDASGVQSYTGGPTPVAKTANYTVTTTEKVLTGDASGGDFTFTLYAASGNGGRTIEIINIADTGYITVDANSSETIDGVASVIIGPREKLLIKCDASNWDSYSPRNSVGKNYIINGNMDFSQRGPSFAAAANGSYSLDRWKHVDAGAGIVTISQDTDVPTVAESGMESLSSLKVDCTTVDSSIAASDVYAMTYLMEGQDFQELHEQIVTLSFWVKSTKTGTFCVAFQNSGSDRSYVSEYTVSTTNTWEKKVVTVQLDTSGTWLMTTGIGLRIQFTLASGSDYHGTNNTWEGANDFATSNQVNALDSTSNNFLLSQVKLEKGSVATPFTRAGGSIAGELVKCQRYVRAVVTGANEFIGAIGTAGSATNMDFSFTLDSPMRSTPSLTATATDWKLADRANPGIDCTAISLNTGGKLTLLLRASVASGLTTYRPYYVQDDGTGSRTFILDAEL